MHVLALSQVLSLLHSGQGNTGTWACGERGKEERETRLCGFQPSLNYPGFCLTAGVSPGVPERALSECAGWVAETSDSQEVRGMFPVMV